MLGITPTEADNFCDFYILSLKLFLYMQDCKGFFLISTAFHSHFGATLNLISFMPDELHDFDSLIQLIFGKSIKWQRSAHLFIRQWRRDFLTSDLKLCRKIICARLTLVNEPYPQAKRRLSNQWSGADEEGNFSVF